MISKHSASEPLLGYLYQCRLALLEALKRLKEKPDIDIAIEALDDIVFADNGKPSEIIQVKHHVNKNTILTDNSVELWKTIRIWCELFSDNIPKSKPMLYLITTASAKNHSAVSYLRSENRDVQTAIDLLAKSSHTSSNQHNKPSYDIFNKLSEQQKKELFERVFILDNTPNIIDVEKNLHKELFGHCKRKYLGQFIGHLEGWWFNKIIEKLNIKNTHFSMITGTEIDAQLDNLREQFRQESLPIDPNIKCASPDVTPFSNYTFAKQLQLIEVSEKRINSAAINYYKAQEQRSLWVREALLVDVELENYDDKLREEWSIRFEQMKDSIANTSTENEFVASGQKIYQWIEADANFPIRTNCQEHFITRGSYQILANKLQVGWHPYFDSRIIDRK